MKTKETSQKRPQIFLIVFIILMVLMILSLFVLLYFISLEKLSDISIFHIAVNIYAILVTMAILLCCRDYYKFNENIISFFVFLFNGSLCCFISAGLWLLNNTIYYLAVRRILYIVSYFLSYFGNFFFYLYLSQRIAIFNNLQGKKEVVPDLKAWLSSKRNLLVLIVGFLVLAFCLFSGRIFTLTNEGNYIKGSYSFIPAAINVLQSILFCFLTFKLKNIKTYISYIMPFIFVNVIIVAWLIISPYYEPTFCLICNSALITYVISYIDMEKESQKLSEQMSRIASNLDINENEIRKKNVAVLQCKIREFDTFIKFYDAEKIYVILNHFFSELSNTIEENNGIILDYDNFAVIALYGSKGNGRFVPSALKTAFSINKKMREINDWNLKHGFAEISVSTSICTGKAVLGNIGTLNHMRFSALTRMTDLSSLLLELTKDNEIIINEDTQNAAGIILNTYGRQVVRFKGFEDPIFYYKIYEGDK